jgi:hypothetical protein
VYEEKDKTSRQQVEKPHPAGGNMVSLDIYQMFALPEVELMRE